MSLGTMNSSVRVIITLVAVLPSLWLIIIPHISASKPTALLTSWDEYMKTECPVFLEKGDLIGNTTIIHVLCMHTDRWFVRCGKNYTCVQLAKVVPVTDSNNLTSVAIQNIGCEARHIGLQQ